jgi:hypothetical protein
LQWIVYLRLTASLPEEPYEVYSELQKRIEAPFAPSTGLVIGFSSINIDDPGLEAYRQVISQSRERFPSHHKIEAITYYPGQQYVAAKCYLLCQSPQQLESYREQAILGFGFTRDISEVLDDDDV